MQEYMTSTIKLGHKVSFVLWLIDQFSSLGCNEEVAVFLNGAPANFQRKAGGYLVFTDLEEDQYQVAVSSPYYLTEHLVVKPSGLDRADPTVYIPLKPAPAYRFNPGTTLIRASLVTRQNEPLAAAITATIISDICARARLGRQGAKSGTVELPLVDVTGRLAPGDLLLIRSLDSKDGEICEISSMGSGEGVYSLKNPLSMDHNRGDLLMPVVASCSDSRGEAVLALRQLRQKECRVQVEVGTGKSKSVQEVQITNGQVHQLGKITV
ncbi:MAG: hypothetical protein ACM3NT_10085 [Methylocystaceae bacterium]